jgi:monodechloroaminopyrrolnitrin synthase
MLTSDTHTSTRHHLPEITHREDGFIAGLDPLQADELIKQVPQFNNERNTVALVLLLVDVLPSVTYLKTFDVYQANAAMRDIGLLLGSLKRHGVEPVNVIPQLEEKLNMIAQKTNLPPRDTLLHYTIWNPDGSRRRSYTGTDDELYLIDSVKIGMNPLVKGIYNLRNLYRTPLQYIEFKTICETTATHFESMVEAIVLARRKVSPAYFANELRLYFDPIILNEKIYLGPGAVEMPMFVYDHLLWSSDCQDPEYVTFKETYLPYVHTQMREIYKEFENKPSLITQVCHTLETLKTVKEKVDDDNLKAFMKLCILLKSFRMPHKKVAEEAYKQSEERTKGSGGYSTDILSHILMLTNDRVNVLEESIKKYMLSFMNQ